MDTLRTELLGAVEEQIIQWHYKEYFIQGGTITIGFGTTEMELFSGWEIWLNFEYGMGKLEFIAKEQGKSQCMENY